MQGVGAYMGFMCLVETYKIYRLLQESQLHQHPLFESARSSTVTINDSAGASQRLNDRDRDDEEAPKVQHTELRPFAGVGITLSGAQPSAATSQEARPASRTAWLDRVEGDAAAKKKTVQQLEDERIERERCLREQAAE